MTANALITVWLDVAPEREEEFNDWYRLEHIPQAVDLPGFVSGRRYTAVTASGPKYLTAYELADRDAFESPAGLQARKTPWTAKMRSLFQNTRRRMCRLILPSVQHREVRDRG